MQQIKKKKPWKIHSTWIKLVKLICCDIWIQYNSWTSFTNIMPGREIWDDYYSSHNIQLSYVKKRQNHRRTKRNTKQTWVFGQGIHLELNSVKMQQKANVWPFNHWGKRGMLPHHTNGRSVVMLCTMPPFVCTGRCFTWSRRSPCGHSSKFVWAILIKETFVERSTSTFLLHGLLFFVTLAEGSVAIHQSHFQMTVGSQLLVVYLVLWSEHLTDLHEGFVLGLRNDEDGVEGHDQADHAEDQVTVRTCSHLRRGDTQNNCD